MATQKDEADQLTAVKAQLDKISGEITGLQGTVDTLNQKITDLEAIIAAGGDATPELIAGVDAVKVAAQAVDDQIPDAPTP